MEKLIEYTGGRIILTVLFILTLSIGMAFTLVNMFLDLAKNTYVKKSKKREYVICIVISNIVAFVIGWLCGYYFGITQMI